MDTGIPETVIVPAGTFFIGSPDGEVGRHLDEGPRRRVTFGQPFAVGRFAVTVDQFAKFVAVTMYAAGTECWLWHGAGWRMGPGSFREPGFAQRGDHPAVCVSWGDAQAYVRWLCALTSQRFRLLSEAEWEYAARAGTVTPYWWGTAASADQANYMSNGSVRAQTVPARAYEANAWGLYQMHGNVWEWVADRWHGNLGDVPADGGAYLGEREDRRVLRGGSWVNSARGVRAARRHAAAADYRRNDIGFRVARTL